ncbi:MAG: TIGR00296 family protein [Euryarchaeota archaeon]|nr:TIGR00296 family protein [Euryarchaeota archaeon]
MLTLEEGVRAVKLARSAVDKYVRDGEILCPEKLPKKFSEKRGVFVTLKKNGLRGCIGHPYPIVPLGEAIIDSAISSAAKDPRFMPLRAEELDKMTIEVTVLTPPRPIRAKPTMLPKKIEIGKHGLIITRGRNQGLLLPQVGVEHGMDEEEFLSQTCMKAGLYPDAWLEEGTQIHVFEGQIFVEKTPRGDVEERRIT